MNDKQQHFMAGLIIALLFGWLVYPMFGLMMAVLIGGLKELFWDLFLDKGTPDMQDFIVTVEGGLVGSIVLLVLQALGV